jgi:transposase
VLLLIFENVILDEKAYKFLYEYATILIDSDKDCVFDLLEGREEKSVRHFFLH